MEQRIGRPVGFDSASSSRISSQGRRYRTTDPSISSRIGRSQSSSPLTSFISIQFSSTIDTATNPSSLIIVLIDDTITRDSCLAILPFSFIFPTNYCNRIVTKSEKMVTQQIDTTNFREKWKVWYCFHLMSCRVK